MSSPLDEYISQISRVDFCLSSELNECPSMHNLFWSCYCFSLKNVGQCPKQGLYLSKLYFTRFFRWKIQFGGGPDGTRREMKHERATHALSSGLMAGTACIGLFCYARRGSAQFSPRLHEITSHALLFLVAQHVPPPGERGV